MSAKLILAGDLGATKTDLVLFVSEPGNTAILQSPLRRARFINADFDGFDSLLTVFLQGECPLAACFGVAGPVRKGRVRMTNLAWELDEGKLQKRHGIGRVRLINDLVATAMGAVALPEEDLHILHPGRKTPNTAVAVLAPGSGLGEAFLVPTERGWLPCASEGAHAAFAPANEAQIALLRFMWSREGTDSVVSVEQVCSGLGLSGLFSFAATQKPVADELCAELAATETANDRNPLILRAALQALHSGEEENAALYALRLMADILAVEAAALSLKTMAQGGLFLGGGLSPRLLPFLEPSRFMAIFSRGVHREWLCQIPIRVIATPACALLGAALCCGQRNED